MYGLTKNSYFTRFQLSLNDLLIVLEKKITTFDFSNTRKIWEKKNSQYKKLKNDRLKIMANIIKEINELGNKKYLYKNK